MLKCTKSAAGGISHLLKPGPAMILFLDKNPLMTAPSVVSIRRRIRGRGCYVDALPVSTGGRVGQIQQAKLECKDQGNFATRRVERGLWLRRRECRRTARSTGRAKWIRSAVSAAWVAG